MADYSPLAVEQRTRAWLQERFREGIKLGYDRRAGVFEADGRPCRVTLYAFQLLQRKLKIFRLLDRLRFESFIDVGAGFEDYPKLVRERYGAAPYYADFNHQANLPFDGFESDRLDHAVTASLARLPFPDGAFDVVLCSEGLEHLVRPVEAIAELRRIARKAVIVTSLEAFAPRPLARWWLHYRVDVTVPHVERNFLSWADLRILFGDDARFEALLDSTTLPVPITTPRSEQEAVYLRLRDRAALVDTLVRAVRPADPAGPHRTGILAAIDVDHGGAFAATRADDDRALVSWVVDRTAAIEREQLDAIDRYAFITGTILRREPSLAADAFLPALLELAAVPCGRRISSDLLAHLCCPDCRSRLAASSTEVRCTVCKTIFAVDCGVPMLYPRRMPDDAATEPELLERLAARTAVQRQRLRRLRRRLRRNERPAGPFRRAVWTL